MYDLDRIKKEFAEICKEHGVELSHPIYINPRLTRTLGRVTSYKNYTGEITPKDIEFSKELLETASDDSVLEVIKHEACHYILAATTHVNHHHDATFHALANSMGISGNATTDVERTVDSKSKYQVICNGGCGGAVIGNYSRMCSTLRNLSNCTCKRCGQSKLTYIQNW